MQRVLGTLALLVAFGAPLLFGGAQADDDDPLVQIRAHHLMISTDDYQGTIDWYRDKLGFDLVREWTTPSVPGSQHAFLELSGFTIEVVDTPTAFQDRRPPTNLTEALSNRGYGYMAFLSEDVNAVAQALESRGVQVVLPPTDFDNFGHRLMFVRDNNGNLIEFMTPLSVYED